MIACSFAKWLEDTRKAELSENLGSALSGLREREEYVLRRRYFDGETLKRIGAELGVGVERTRQIEAKALRMLRHPSKRKIIVGERIKENIERPSDRTRKPVLKPKPRRRRLEDLRRWELIDECKAAYKLINDLKRRCERR